MRKEVARFWRQRNGMAGLLLLTFTCLAAQAATWFPMGPFGGDARSFGFDPGDSRHIYLGTTTGWIYDSHDGGSSWTRVARLGTHDDLVIRHILVDPRNPKRLLVGAWKIDRPDGGVFISDNGGKTWYEQAQMRGQSVRSMARSASDPSEIVAGTLQGIFWSKDGGTHWSSISPTGSTEIHEVESLAIDPADPNVIYAGTWHLPWKTTDGGATWTNIKTGLIDDSDVFSIIVDPANPKIVYASACSGIYKSLDSGGQFRKIQGIPSTARRTRRLLQDPTAPDVVFAGTTEGLYRTKNAGDSFTRITGGDVIINDVYIDPSHPEHVLLATDRGGVLSSEDGGDTFQPSNKGFAARQVLAYTADLHNAGTIYVGVVNDKATGGVFRSFNGGAEWEQQSDGLGGRDVFSLATTSSGTLLAGTSHGVFRLESGLWTDSNAMEIPAAPETVAGVPAASPAEPPAVVAPRQQEAPLRAKPSSRKPSSRALPAKHSKMTVTRAKGKGKAAKAPLLRRVTARQRAHNPAGQRGQAHKLQLPPASAAPVPAVAQAHQLDATVYEMTPLGDSVYAATATGLMRSADDGHHWASVDSLTMPEVHYVAGQKTMVLAGGLRRLALSMDNGVKWDTLALPADLTQLSAMAVDELGNLWVGGAEGVYYSTDYGLTWKTLRNLFTTAVDGIYFDKTSHRVLVTTSNATIVFAAHLPDYKVSFWETGWHLRFVRPVGDHLIGATLFDGMVLQPRMVAPDGEKAAVADVSAVQTGPSEP